MDQIPPEVQRAIDDLTSDLTTLRLPMATATATLPIAKAVQQALHFWHAQLPLALEIAGQAPQGLYVSLAADLQRVTWHTMGDTPGFTGPFMDYLNELEIPAENRTDLERVLERAQPAQLGAWITGRKDTFDLGWYLAPRDGRLENGLPLLPDSPDKAHLVAWAAQYAVDECVRVGRSLVSQDQLSDVTVKISGDTPRQAVETGLLLLRSLALPFPPAALVEAILRQDQTEVFASLWLGQAGAAKVGLLLPQPTTELVLRLCDAAGQHTENSLAIFEACLGAGSPAFVEPQQLADGWGVELHYAIE
jgi:hypothetical protein